MLKAVLRVRVTIAIEGDPFDVVQTFAEEIGVRDRQHAEALAHDSADAALVGGTPLVGTHVPDLVLARGGDPERPR